MRRNQNLILILLVAGAAGCATPQSLVHLRPDAPDVIWVGGRASVRLAADGIVVASAFERQDDDKLAVRLEVQNGTANRFEIQPSRVTYSTCRSFDVVSCRGSRRVIDPEQALVAIDTQVSREKASATNEQIFLGTVVLLSAVGDVATIASGHADRTTGLQTAATGNMMSNSEAAADRVQTNLAKRREVWSDQALRRNTLFPGQAAGGLVYIPIDETAQYVWVQTVVAGHTFSFHYVQTVTEVSDPVTAGH